MFSFKTFNTFVDLEGHVSDEQLNELFGAFRNNSKLEKLRAERDRLKQANKGRRGDDIDAGLARMAGKPAKSTKPNVLDDDDIEAAFDSRDRKVMAKDDRNGKTQKELETIRNKLGLRN